MELKLSENIRILRKEHNLTQEQLAEALGVSVSAVYKWESGQSLPEIRLLVELASLFETSVDALLGYGWDSGGMAQAAQKIQNYTLEKNLEEGLPFAERFLRKYPNSFEVVYRSAKLYFLGMTADNGYADRARELFQDSLRLFSQNPYEDIGIATIENQIALCHVYRKQFDEAIALFRKNNTEGQNEFRIGQLLSIQEGRSDEALPHLSNALGWCYSTLCSITSGYCNAYTEKGEYGKLKKLMLWFYDMCQGLRDSSRVCYMDRMDVRVFATLAAIANKQGNLSEAAENLRKAKAIAKRFDAAPNYSVDSIYYYHGSENTNAYDDMGETAMDIVQNSIREGKLFEGLAPLWEEICHEET